MAYEIHYQIGSKSTFPCLLRTYTTMRVPTRRKPRLDIRLTILLSFAAGFLIGVPLTFGAMVLGTFHLSLQPVAGNVILPQTNSSHRKTDGNVSTSSGTAMLSGYLNELESRPSNKIADGIFWTDAAESLVPKGFGRQDHRQWRTSLNDTHVLNLEEGCGRMQNRLVVLSNGEKSCCRYRHNNDQIQGEIFSFYLGRLLQIDNLVPSVLALVDPRDRHWSYVSSQMALAQWSPERPAVLTRFVPNLQPAYIPRHFREAKKRRLHNTPQDLTNLTLSEVSELIQWSDLILFDYLTANLDRVVNNMFNERWNGDMMSQPTHNLAKTPEGLLVFLDNESGLVHGYRLLDKYEPFHRSLLDSLCLFRKKTVTAVKRLYRENDLEVALRREFDPRMSEWLPFLPENSLRVLKRRLGQVLRQVERCNQPTGIS